LLLYDLSEFLESPTNTFQSNFARLYDTAELLKHGNGVITGQLAVLFNSIWREVDVPDVCKNKGIIVKVRQP